ncbi:MAG: crotonase/enoyl-CoA hydratase family protein [Acidimicrobiales bacterium]|jgi:enoyl-CoA hydratase
MSDVDTNSSQVLFDVISTAHSGSIAVITINRPECRNAVDGPTADLLAAAFRRFDDDAELSVAVLTGADGAFCAGADLKAVSTGNGNKVRTTGDGPLGCTRMQLTKPVIAAVEGHAVAGGLELALWADLRVASTEAVFGVYCRRWGVPLVDGGTIRLPRLIGQSRANDMILTGRGISGDEAMEFGLANRLVAPGAALEASIDMASDMAGFPQNCLRSDRRSSYEQWSMSLDEALAHETLLGRQVIATGETSDGAARFANGEGRHGAFS